MAPEIERVHVAQMMENPSVFSVRRQINPRLKAFLDVLNEEAPGETELDFKQRRIRYAETGDATAIKETYRAIQRRRLRVTMTDSAASKSTGSTFKLD
jgi:hypothetical protein